MATSRPPPTAAEGGNEEEEPQEPALEDGPDISGATDAVDDNDGVDDQIFIPRPLQEMNNGLEADRIRDFVMDRDLRAATRENPIVLLTVGEPLYNYDTPHLQSMAFPTLRLIRVSDNK